jgi:hypothetical protein
VAGSIIDPELVRATLHNFGINAVIHAGALHKPQVATHAASNSFPSTYRARSICSRRRLSRAPRWTALCSPRRRR